MKTYASTFIAGLKDVVREMLEAALPDVEVRLLLDGLVVYRTAASVRELAALRFFNNSFLVLELFDDLSRRPIHEMVSASSRRKGLRGMIGSRLRGINVGRTFRVMALDRNQHVSFDRQLRDTLEKRISGIRGLRVDRARPDTEFWFLYRDEGIGLFMVRLTSHMAYEQVLEKGELHPELAHALCFLSDPRPSDIFLDPFCGYGAIPIERALAFPFNMIFATDRDPEKKRFVRNRLKSLNVKNTFIVKTQDALDLDAFEDDFIHKIVTDPPWGLYEDLELGVHDFHRRLLTELHRVLRPAGVLVLLTAQKEALEDALADVGGGLRLLRKYDILVSGKKAAIYKLLKVPESD